ncbi:ATP-binding protein [Actomonas aquatica]|uniref:histidine kinase n=1 Tax=Actomonas aquatica TaxID=2866162 RepID=A0ABZ1C3A6_9BACT|nr:ATP-binding protein [Opitutus sp. WL0086]WRQ86029.1 ATP-binding protein [Opitutus sp. WL0086]
MLQRLAPLVAWIDVIYAEHSAFARLRARLLFACNVVMLCFVPLNIGKVLWLDLPNLPGRILFNSGLALGAVASLVALRRGNLLLAGEVVSIIAVTVIHVFTFFAPMTINLVGITFQVFVLDVVFLLLTLIFASKRAAYAVFGIIIGSHLSLHILIIRPELNPVLLAAESVILRDGLLALVFIFLLGLTVSRLIEAANRRSEEALAETRALNAKLEELVAERTQALELATQRAHDASRAKSEFLANMSHEIRTPLNGVIATAELLQRDAALSPEAAERVRLVSHSGDLLLRLLGDILDLSKIEAGQLTLEVHPFSLRELVSDNLALFASRAAENNVRFEIELADDLPAHVEADSHRLRQVLSNLASNALKFTPPGGCIRVMVTKVATANDGADPAAAPSPVSICFAVQDSGIGMDEATLAKVFERFAQADSSTTRRYGGSGLGLAICIRLVELMGGHLDAESKPGNGSTFRFTLPLRPTDAPVDSERSAKQKLEPLGLQVLLVEDNRVNRTILAAQLRELGCTCTLATDGEQALEVLDHASPLPDLVLMDCHMPVLDGWEATRRLRAWATSPTATERNRAAAALPVLALTAAALPEERARCHAAGMNGFIAKPAKLAHLHQSLREHRPRGRADS